MSAGVTGTRLSRVFMTADAVGGVWPYALELAAGYAARGIATDLAILGPLPGARAAAAMAIPGVRIFETGLPLEWTAAAPGEVDEASRILARLAEINRPDVVHLNTPALAAGARFPAPVVAVMHSCVATWWRAVRAGPVPADFAWRTELTARGLEAADAVVAVSRSLSAAVKDVYGSGLDIEVVVNGRTSLPRAKPEEKERFVLTAGRLWDDGKNIAALDRAAGQLTVPVIAAGPVSGPNGARGHFGRLRLVGDLDESELAGWYQRAPLFASAARYEPFGFTVLEAAQAGAALVLSDIPSFRELWDGAAMFVAGDDYAPVLQALIDSPEELTLLGDRAMHRAERYSARRMVRGLLDVYRTTVCGAVAPAA